MTRCKYAVPENYPDMKVWMAFVAGRSLHPCTDAECDCEHCQHEQFCVCDDVLYKGVPFIQPGEVEWVPEYRSLGKSSLRCSKTSTGAKHARWRFIKGLPHKGFLLIQKIVRLSGQNMFKIGDSIYWEPCPGYTLLIDDEEWHTCFPILDMKHTRSWVYTKITYERSALHGRNHTQLERR
jgi:hypothetical protein